MNLLQQLGLAALQNLATPSTLANIPPETIAGMNAWAKRTVPNASEPFAGGGNELSDGWTVDGWGRVWLQRQCWLKHQSGVQSRWILGRGECMESVRRPS